MGYFPAPAKSWAICPRRDEDKAKEILATRSMPLKFSRGQRYVGGFVGSDMIRERWVAPMVEKWVAGIVEYPQSAYVGLTQCLQPEWQYVCRVDPGVGPLLQPVEDALVSSFLPALFDFKQNQQITDSFRELLGNAVKQGGLAIRNPTVGASRLHQQSVESVDQLVESLVSNGDLDNKSHAVTVRAASSKARAERCKAEAARLKELAAGNPKVERWAERMGRSGAWLGAIPCRFSGTELTYHTRSFTTYCTSGTGSPFRTCPKNVMAAGPR